jgi:hypothetical protein
MRVNRDNSEADLSKTAHATVTSKLENHNKEMTIKNGWIKATEEGKRES